VSPTIEPSAKDRPGVRACVLDSSSSVEKEQSFPGSLDPLLGGGQQSAEPLVGAGIAERLDELRSQEIQKQPVAGREVAPSAVKGDRDDEGRRRELERDLVVNTQPRDRQVGGLRLICAVWGGAPGLTQAWRGW